MLLTVEQITAGYGPITVLDGLSLQVRLSERLAMIGRNGMGKSTTLRSIMGLVAMRAGRIVFDGEDLTPAWRRTSGPGEASVMSRRRATSSPR